MILYIARHAWAFAPDARQFPDDDQRPLTPEGRKRFARVAKKLVRRGVRPELIATSPLVRCRQTADIWAQRLDGAPTVVDQTALAPGSDLEWLAKWSAEQPVGELAWVGHAPDVGRLTSELIGGRGADVDFAKGAVAAIRFADHVSVGAGELVWLVTAKMLGE